MAPKCDENQLLSIGSIMFMDDFIPYKAELFNPAYSLQYFPILYISTILHILYAFWIQD